jgi:tetratricopeptide (TPR) repeat protein
MFARDLASLVDQCRAYGAKLVLTCQRQTWELYQLWRYIPSNEIFMFNVEAIPVPTQAAGLRRTALHSFLLGDLTSDELTAVIHRRLPPERAARAALLLRAPSFAALRNPYFLARYLDQHGEHLAEANEPPAPVSINELLDARVEQALNNIGPSLGFSTDDLRPAFHSLIDGLWHARPAGLLYRQAIEAVSPHLREQAGNFITELRRGGLLTAVGPLNIAEPPVADRFFASRLAEQSIQLSEICEHLRPETDAGVAATLMRGVVTDPVALAEALLARDKRWTKAIADGLAQCEPNDYQVLGFTAALMRSDPEKIFIEEAGDALGQLASRGRRSWRLAAGMYYSSDPSERYRGEYVLGVSMEFDPVRASAAVRLKLARSARMPNFFTSDRERRARLLKGALDPLRLIKHEAAARVGQRLTGMYGSLAGRGEHDLDYDFLEDLDRARGRIVLYAGGGELDALLDELSSDDRLVRYRAACALRGPAIEQPARVQQSLCIALQREVEYAPTVNRLLLAAYPLVSAAPDYYLNVLSASPLTRWDEPTLSTSQVLGHLGDLAAGRPAEVYRLLPRRLDAYSPEDRALLSELLSYAWWRCAEHVGEAAAHLAVLAEPDLADVEGEYVPFALRGAAIAQLGLMCLGLEPADELTGEQIFYPRWDLIFTYVNTRHFVRRLAAALSSRAGYERLRETLIRCAREAEPTNLNPLNQTLVQAVFRCSVLCLEMLTHFAAAAPDPMSLLSAVPRDWRALHIAGELLEAGRRDQALIDFAKEVCEEVMHGTTTFQAMHEQEVCLAELAVIGNDPHAALEEHRAATRDNFFNTDGKARGLARLIDANPDETLSLLDESIREESDHLTLHHLEDLTRSWRALLIARVYARVFDSRPITTHEAGELCEQVLAAVDSLPDSPHRQEYLDVYGGIRSWLGDITVSPQPLPDATPTLLRQSHAFAVSILQRANESLGRGDDSAWLADALSDRRGWMESKYTFGDGRISHGSWPYLNYVYPAPRLALVSVGQRYGLSDPAAQLLRERKDVNELVRGYSHLFSSSEGEEGHESNSSRRALEDAEVALREQLARTPRDEMLWSWYGGVLLRLGHLDEAEEALQRCLSLPSSSNEKQAGAWYDIACARARRGREDEFRTALEESARLRPLKREHTITDPDLESVRDRDWFRVLIEASQN